MRIANNMEVNENQTYDIFEKQVENSDAKMLNSDENQQKTKDKFKNSDSFMISDEAKRMFLEQLEDSKKENPYEDLIKLIEIANRISKGDKVPPSDEKKLLEKEPDMYLSAKMAAEMSKNKKRKNHKALFEEENNETKEQLNQLKVEDDFSDYESSVSVSESEASAEMTEGQE